MFALFDRCGGKEERGSSPETKGPHPPRAARVRILLYSENGTRWVIPHLRLYDMIALGNNGRKESAAARRSFFSSFFFFTRNKSESRFQRAFIRANGGRGRRRNWADRILRTRAINYTSLKRRRKNVQTRTSCSSARDSVIITRVNQKNL
ncbi:hypothetical protein PUN28_010741 [Cardiocondyla obscurior]|uniref:Uncharacterized protein n=1 Tax=Cardiocondyla obscurior TaxID=286306 RepID=A0AAW2FN88_9HYME